MKTRILSSVFILGPLLIFMFLGGIPLFCITAVLSAIGLHEFYKGYENIGVHSEKIWAYVLFAALYILVFFGNFTNMVASTYTHLLELWFFAAVCLGLFISLLRPDHNIIDGPVTTLGLIYIAYFFTHLSLINCIDKYSKMIWIVLLAAFGQDTFAYFSGYLFGKHKMCPNISPKKTIEGAVGGVLGSVICCGVFGYFVYPEILVHCLIIGFIGAFFGMGGDLVASAFKRKMGIKDYGNLIPGHGGIMDRFDSILLVAPFVYYYILVFVRP